MGLRPTAVLAAALAAMLAFAAVAGAALIGIYRNGMESEAQRSQMVKLYGERCARQGTAGVLRIVVGKRTRACAYRTPVVGRDLEIAATERLLSGTPAPLQHKAFLALNLRADSSGSGYQLLVYPLQRKVQLRKTLTDGTTRYLAIEKAVEAVKGVNEANALRLSAINLGGEQMGQCQVVAYVGGQPVAEATDEACSELQGRFAGVSVGAATSAKGLLASVDNVVVRVPSPF